MYSSVLKLVCYVSFVWMVSSCKTEQPKPFTSQQKEILFGFAKVLRDSINHYDFDLLRKSWDAEKFRRRVKPLEKAEQNAFDVVYSNEVSRKVFNANVDMVNKLKFNDGKIYLTRVTFFPNHMEATYSMVYGQMVDFLRFRMELDSLGPRITDYNRLKEDKWQSSSLVDLMTLNSTFTSSQKREISRCESESEKALLRGDTLMALDWLYKMPELPGFPSANSIRRVQLAFNLGDSILIDVVSKERDKSESVYVKYLYCFYVGDCLQMNDVVDYLRAETGKDNHLIDSLATFRYFWN